MIQEFVNYEQALALKELGFDEPCFGGYDMETLELWIGYSNDGEQFNREYYCPTPTFSQALRWFRNRGFIIDISSEEDYRYSYRIGCPEVTLFSDLYDTYEEAENGCIDKLIELSRHFQQYD